MAKGLFKKNFFLNKLSKENEIRRKKLLTPNKTELLREKFKNSASFVRNIFSFLFVDSLVVNEELRENILENLIKLDFGVFLAEKLSNDIVEKLRSFKSEKVSVKDVFKEVLKNFYFQKDLAKLPSSIKKSDLNVFLVTGPNGSGKTTSIAKLANKYKLEDYKILLVASDTFRAGASEQLEKWANKLDLPIILPEREKEDPSSLIYKSLKYAEEQKFNLVICDTSGKQHNNVNLMKELEKIYRTIKKFNSSAPQESFLVVDSTIGQSAFFQAESFLKNANISGIILSKVDTLTRGGTIFLIKERFNIPVKYIGTGENLEDLHEFNLDEIIDYWMNDLPSEVEFNWQ